MSRWLSPEQFTEVFNSKAKDTADHLLRRFPGIVLARYASDGHVEFKLTGKHFHALGYIDDKGDFSFSMLEGNGIDALEAVLKIVSFKD